MISRTCALGERRYISPFLPKGRARDLQSPDVYSHSCCLESRGNLRWARCGGWAGGRKVPAAWDRGISGDDRTDQRDRLRVPVCHALAIAYHRDRLAHRSTICDRGALLEAP